jgi:CheY-like chemotaxis protein
MTTPTSGPHLDDEAIQRIRKLGGEKLLSKLAGMFVAGAPRRVDAIRAGLASADPAAVAHGAHDLRSSCGLIGAVVMESLCREIESLGDEGKLDRVPDLIAHLDAEFATVRVLLDGEIALRPARVRRSIAVVEDNADNRLLVRVILEDAFDLTEYETGLDALTGMHSAVPDLVLLDISLPGMDGVEVLGQLRADGRFGRVPIVALTAHAMAGDREKYLAAGFDGYITKPITDEKALLDLIDELLRPPDALIGG